MSQKWKTDPTLHSCERVGGKKKLEYGTTYVDEFLNSDPLRDWESIDRCKALWLWAQRTARLNHTRAMKMKVLDCGAKDGQFPEWLKDMVTESLGIEISEPYVNYCKERNRPVVYGDVCNLPQDWSNKWDFVFSHHLLGLTPDYWKGLTEMFRCTAPGGYMLTLNDVPGNPKKHYSLIEDDSIFQKFIEGHECEVIFNGRWNENFEKEWVLYVKKYAE